MITTTPVSLQHAGLSDTGRRRDNNEDSFLEAAQLGLFIVADGMGGYLAGDVASQLTVNAIREQVAAGESLPAATLAAQQALMHAVDQGTGDVSMGTTVVAVKFDQQQARDFQLAWVGDSRAYLWHADQLQRLSKDHSYVQGLVDQRLITARQAETHPQKNLLSRCLSGGQFELPEVDLINGSLAAGDLLLLCTDGLSNELDDIEIAQLLHEHGDRGMAELAQRLIDTALDHGGRDNVTVLLVKALT